MKKFILPAIVLLGLLMTGCSSVSTGPDEQALHYKAGPLSSKEWADCVATSTRAWNGPGDEHFIYPAGQRTFSFTGRSGAESQPITVKTKDAQELSVNGFVTFELTTDCDALRKFHEQIGSKYKAYKSGGWRKFLGDYLAVPLNATMDKAALAYDWRTLYSSSTALTSFEERVKENLPDEVRAGLGDAFVTIKAVSLETPIPSEQLRAGLEAKEKAKLDNDAQKERNATAATKYESLRACKKVMSEQSCVILKLAEDGDVPLYPIPSGGNLNITPQG